MPCGITCGEKKHGQQENTGKSGQAAGAIRRIIAPKNLIRDDEPDDWHQQTIPAVVSNLPD